ncbi:MAG: ferrous iron transport protein B [Solobacterium sp.]|nr:ferrous iron transport protein B [Solobacterium sp.]
MAEIKIALAGNPNSGKTTLFNGLTGSNQFVGNWPGVTVEKKEGRLKGHDDVIIQDLPGIYSLSPYTLEEVVSRNYLMIERPDAILNIVDGTNIERNLYLTTQLTELGIPVVVAVNMADLIAKNGDKLDLDKLSKEIGCRIVSISALKGDGIQEAAEEAVKAAKSTKTVPMHRFSKPVEKALEKITGLLTDVPADQKRFYAVKVFERDDKALAALKLSAGSAAAAEAATAAVEKELDDDAESIITNERYVWISDMLSGIYRKANKGELSTSDKIDRIMTNRWLALPIFAVIMWFVYYLSVTTIGTIATDWTNDVLFGEIIPPAVEGFLESINCAGWLQSLIVDGIIGGVGAVLGFVPQMFVLFFLLAFLESCGYMARIAFIMDRLFRKFGLSGKSFIPILIGTGCGVPAVMASRTIENDRDRKMSIMTTTFIPCGAKLPIIAMIAGCFFNNSAIVSVSAFFIGMAAIVCSGIILKKTKMFAGDPAPFVMELPAYHMPTIGALLRSMWERGWSFIKKAGSVILISTIVIWFLMNFSFSGGFHMIDFGDAEGEALAALQESCVLAKIGSLFAPLFKPLGFGTWQMTVAAVSGLVAKENVVATIGQVFGYAEVGEEGEEFWELLAANITPLAAYSYLVFNLLCAPCFAAIGAIKREMNNAKWTWFAIGYQCALAYVVSFCIYQLGRAFTGNFGFGAVIACVLVAGFIWLLFRPYRESQKLTVKVGA